MPGCIGNTHPFIPKSSDTVPTATSDSAERATHLSDECPQPNQLSRDLKTRIAKFSSPAGNRKLRFTDRDFRRAGALNMTTLTIPGEDVGKLVDVPLSLPAITQIKIVFNPQNIDANLDMLTRLDPVILSKIHHCDIWGSITDAGLDHLQKLPQLKSLNLTSSGGVTDAHLACLQSLPRLQSLNLDGHNKKITNVGFSHLQHLTQLRSLDLGNCPQITNDSIVFLRSMPQLTSLVLPAHNLTNTGLEIIASLIQLQTLDLSFAEPTGASLVHLQPLTQLQSLTVSNITDTDLEHLQPLRHLQSLKLGNLWITDGAGLANLHPLAQLHTLTFESCIGLTCVDLTRLRPLAKLTSLHLAFCPDLIDADLPRFRELAQLQTLHFDACSSISQPGVVRLKASMPLLKVTAENCMKVSQNKPCLIS